jgi:hypothetical protein
MSATVAVELVGVDVIGCVWVLFTVWVFWNRTVRKNGTWNELVTAGVCSLLDGC